MAIKPVTTSIAAAWTPTAASASMSESDVLIRRADASPKQSGTSAGTSITPAPCAVDMMNDQSASPAYPAGDRALCGARPHRQSTARTISSPPATACSTRRFIDRPSATAAATAAIEAACPIAIGASASSACARLRERTPQAAAHIQPVAGFSP
ncbi:hypothetical protein [Variovorax sp. PBS-H4]|uniref:hypothetical protein n=1 Tax=Variovorax sp. PBS-H4 TaxID=434008 RepID=UPI0013A5992B